jgi:large subunit ribosomal protein L1
MEIQTIEKALEDLKKEEKRKFVQTVDLIINLQKFDARKESLNTFVQIPHPAPKKICAIITRKTELVDFILKEDFVKYKELTDVKKLAKKYDFFVAVASLMPEIATKFGRVFGPMGKMPSPQAGIIPADNDAAIKAMVDKMKSVVKIKSKERSLKIPVGKEDMSEKELKANIEAILQGVENALPQKNQNIKNALIKYTMSTPRRIR